MFHASKFIQQIQKRKKMSHLHRPKCGGVKFDCTHLSTSTFSIEIHSGVYYASLQSCVTNRWIILSWIIDLTTSTGLEKFIQIIKYILKINREKSLLYKRF